MIYLDNAATTLIKPPAVVHAVTKALRTASNPGRGAHASAMAAAELVYDCREAAAALFHMPDPSRVVFTLNATHALNIAIRSLASRGSRVVISGFEHNAVLRPLHALGAELRIAGRRLFDPQGMLEDFRTLLPGADLAVCTHVSNVFGYILPVEEIAALCREQGVPLIVDASQSAGLIDPDQQRLGAAFIAMPGHKGLLGPAGTGILLCGYEGKPLLYGGTGTNSASPEMPDFLPDRLEAGTCNVPGIAGLREGIRFVSDRGPAAILAHEQRLLRRLAERLAAVPSLRLFTAPELGQAGILSFTHESIDSESFCESLAAHGIAVRGGLHCAPLAHGSAGTSTGGTVRISLSPFVDEAQIDRCCAVIEELLQV